MNINRYNYELFFIDFCDGWLSKEEVNHLVAFLENNPDLKEEFEVFGKLNQPVENEIFAYKNNLKKSITDTGEVNDHTIDEYCVAYIENDLSQAEKKRFLSAINENKAFEITLNRYKNTIQLADLNESFDYKKRLKKSNSQGNFLLRLASVSAVAAAILIGIFLFKPFNQITVKQNTTVVPVSIDSTQNIVLKSADSVEPTSNFSETDKNTSTKKKNKSVYASKNQNTENEEIHLTVEDRKKDSISVIAPIIPDKHQILSLRPDSHENNENIVLKNDDLNASIETQTPINKRGAGLWSLAEKGVNLFGRLNETTIDLEPHFTDDGKLKSISLITDKRKITTPAI